MADISIKVLESNNAITKKIHMALAKEFNKTLSQNVTQIYRGLQPLISSALLSSPELASVSGGLLRTDFGLTSDPSSAIVANFGVEYGAGKGRSGGGYMAVDERPFKVSSQYAGTVDDNFITRAIDGVAPQIKGVIIKAMQ